MDGEEKSLLITSELDRVIRRYVDGVLFSGITKLKPQLAKTGVRRQQMSDDEKESLKAEAIMLIRGGNTYGRACELLAPKYHRSPMALRSMLAKLGITVKNANINADEISTMGA